MTAETVFAPEWAPVADFFVSGTPKGQPRPRFDIRGRRPRAYDPGTADKWRAQIILEAVRRRPSAPILTGAYVVVSFYFPRPKAKAAKAARFFLAKPDIDNATKVVLDALTDAGYWTDDSVVVACDAIKYVTDAWDTGAQIEVFREKEPA